MRTYLVTGGSGFIGSALCRRLVERRDARVVNVDKLTYAGNSTSLREIEGRQNYRFHRADICDHSAMFAIMQHERVDAVIHLAAETHVDRSLSDAMTFATTNFVGTASLLAASIRHREVLSQDRRDGFRFHHVSTDEVFGSLPLAGGGFREEMRYDPSSPYSASKAGADLLVRSFCRSHGLPITISNCSNNYGPYQHPEKLIPKTILNAITGQEIGVYGDGRNVRDWLHVDDHVGALERIEADGLIGESYNVGGLSERSNIAVVEAICDILDRVRPRGDGTSHRELIAFVRDRPGHDRRYAVDICKIELELGWRPSMGFDAGLAATVRWYLENEWWWRPLVDRTAISAPMVVA